ncbi:hypothetical protein [Tomitella biformata]|uniref:hypothetical protein n=1 Tax=Tomitella biformata TaxID=630403 RepID=UPI0004632500|nr:hypothetical protein [Tomitella biformata]
MDSRGLSGDRRISMYDIDGHIDGHYASVRTARRFHLRAEVPSCTARSADGGIEVRLGRLRWRVGHQDL